MKFNAYLSMKRLRREPSSLLAIAKGALPDGRAFTLGVIPSDPPSLGFTVARSRTDAAAETVRVALEELVRAAAAGEARGRHAWTPLQPDELRPGAWFNEVVRVRRNVVSDTEVHLSWVWLDAWPFIDWRVCMRIKAELAGSDWWGIEHLPAEAHVVDQGNVFHLWCWSPEDPSYEFISSLGWKNGRMVMTQAEGDREAADHLGLDRAARSYLGMAGACQRDPETKGDAA